MAKAKSAQPEDKANDQPEVPAAEEAKDQPKRVELPGGTIREDF